MESRTLFWVLMLLGLVALSQVCDCATTEAASTAAAVASTKAATVAATTAGATDAPVPTQGAELTRFNFILVLAATAIAFILGDKF